MSDLEPKPNSQLIKFTSDFEFENDFGKEVLGIGRLTHDQGAIAVASIAGAFVASAVFGPVTLFIVAALGINDILALNKRHREPEAQVEQSPIDVEAVAIEESEPTTQSDSPVDSVATAALPASQLPPFDRSRVINESKGLMIIGDMRS